MNTTENDENVQWEDCPLWFALFDRLWLPYLTFCMLLPPVAWFLLSLYCLLVVCPCLSHRIHDIHGTAAKEEEFDEYAEEFEEHLVTVLDYKLPEAASWLDHGERHTSRTTIIVHQARVCENYHNISRVLFGELLYQNITKVGKCSIFRQTLDGVSEPMTLSSDHPQSALCLEPFFHSTQLGTKSPTDISCSKSPEWNIYHRISSSNVGLSSSNVGLQLLRQTIRTVQKHEYRWLSSSHWGSR